MNDNSKIVGYDDVDPRDYDVVVNALSDFCREKDFLNAAVQHRFSRLAACEDPHTIAPFMYAGRVWPMRMTGQMDLEREILTRLRECPGIYCHTSSYRQEPDPEPGRHDLSFPMFEFELPGGFEALINFEMDMLEKIGFGSKEKFEIVTYGDMCQRFDVDELTSEHEMKMWKEIGPVVLLVKFPEHTSPFWNMKRDDTGFSNKIDVILYGIETIGSAERSTNPDEMRESFLTISNGEYAKRLFADFTKYEIMKELEDFLSLDFFTRCGGGIGMTRMIRAFRLQGLLPEKW